MSLTVNTTNNTDSCTKVTQPNKPVKFVVNWFDFPNKLNRNQEMKNSFDTNGNGYIEFDNSDDGYDESGELFAIADIALGLKLDIKKFGKQIVKLEQDKYTSDNGIEFDITEGFDKKNILKQTTLKMGNYTIVVDFKEQQIDSKNSEIKTTIRSFKGFEQTNKLPQNIEEAVEEYIQNCKEGRHELYDY